MVSYIVTTLADETAATTDLATETADGDGLSLREALSLASANGTADEISFDAGLAGGTLLLANGQLEITSDVSIDGDTNGDDTPDITIDADRASRIFRVADVTAALDGLVITGGSTTSGGGILNTGSLTVTNSTLSNNRAVNYGGGVSNGGVLNLVNVQLLGNSAELGGGLVNGGTVVLTDSTVSNNTGFFAGVGGIVNYGTLLLIDSTLSGNDSYLNSREVGGLRNRGSATLVNSTVSNNSSFGVIGGIENSGTLTLINSTIADNSHLYSFHGYLLSGSGGLSNDGTAALINTTFTGNSGHIGNGGTLTVTNSIIADAGGLRGNGVEIYSGINVFSRPGMGDADDIIETDLAKIFASTRTIDPDRNPDSGDEFQIGLLADNGGPVETILILSQGVAHNAGNTGTLPQDTHDLDDDGDTTEPLPVDARGLVRVFDTVVDIGAVELQENFNGPVAQNDAFATNELTAVNGAANVFADNGGGPDLDDDGDPLSVTRINGTAFTAGAGFALASGALLTMNTDGSFVWDPNGVFEFLPGPESGASSLTAQDSFTYQVEDGNGGIDTATVTITISGVDNDDRLIGTAGEDSLDGGIGNDLIEPKAGDDTLDGGEGDDTVSYADAPGAVVVNLATGTASGVSGSDTLANIENANGGAGNDTLIGDGGNNQLQGLGGNDTLFGNNGDDLLQGGDGDDTIVSGGSNDTAHGGLGIDSLYGGDGDDELDGGAGEDFLLGGIGNDIYKVDETLDLVDEGGIFPDFIGSAFDFDTIISTADWFWDVYSVGERLVIAEGTAGSGPGEAGTTIVGSIFSNEMIGNAGTNIIFGRGGADTYKAGDGIDWISLSLLGVTEENAYPGVDGPNTIIVEQRQTGDFSYDIVFEYEPGKDKVDVTDYGYASGAQVLALGIDDGAGNSYFPLGDGLDYLYLVGITTAQMSGDDFMVS